MKSALWLGLAGCAAPKQPEPNRTAPTLSSLEWSLGWAADGAEMNDDGSWSTTTDLGYRVTVSKGYIVTSLVSLVPCETDTGLASRLMEWVIPTARANHAPYDDPSLLELSAKESLTPWVHIDLPAVTFPESKYCSVYWLLSRGDADTDLSETSVAISGTWTHQDVSGTIDIETDFARAFIAELPLLAADQRSATGTLTRSAGTAFDGIDFSGANEYTVAWGVVKNLTESAEFSLN